MSDNIERKMNTIWLLGAGIMARDYIKVLDGLDKEFLIIGRSEQSAKECEKSIDCEVIRGGLQQFLQTRPKLASYAIVSVGVASLYETTKELLEYGVNNILVEKPGALHKNEFENLSNTAQRCSANVLIAYNRRFYASVVKAQEIIKQDGGVISFHFEFTEWAHVIQGLQKGEGVKEKWFLANSTHVVDLAFHLGGKPKEIATFMSGSLEWHPASSNFSGAGISEGDALFSYQANWESAGRWGVEILTKEHRLIFRPMEKLQIQKRGTIAQEFDKTVDYSMDEDYKPGLYLQTKNFLDNNFTKISTLDEQKNMLDVYNQIAGYNRCKS